MGRDSHEEQAPQAPAKTGFRRHGRAPNPDRAALGARERAEGGASAESGRGPGAALGAREQGAGRVRSAALFARVAFALVFALNVQCALVFLLWPASFAPAFELDGVAGKAAVQALGLVFLMWNTTYPAVIADPVRFRALAAVVLVQQAVGLLGEAWLRLTLPEGHGLLASGIERFIVFDALGLLAMAAAFAWLSWARRRE